MDQPSGVESQEQSRKTPAKPYRYYLNIALVSGLCLSWFIIDHTIVPRKQSLIAPSRLSHGFGIRLPVIGARKDGDERLTINRNLTHFRLEYGFNDTSDFNKTQCTKVILIYGSINNMLDYPEMALILNLFKQDEGYMDGYSDTAHLVCPDVKCATMGLRVGTDPESFRGSDVIVFGMLPKAFGNRLDILSAIKPQPGQTWIYYSQEPPFRVMRWVKDPKLFDLRYHKLMTYNKDSDIQRPFGYYINNNPMITQTSAARSTSVVHKLLEKLSRVKVQGSLMNTSRNKTKLIAWMASNCEEVFWPRYDYIQHLMVYIHIDTYGRCGDLKCLPRDSEQCNWKLNQYKFYLAFTNSECRHYITEKFWHTALQHNIVPVVYGAPKTDFERFAPPNSFIHASDFDSPKELAEYLLAVDKNDTLYNSYFDWKWKGHIRSNFPPHPGLFCDILAHLEKDSRSEQQRTNEDQKMSLKLLGDSSWWNTCRYEVNTKTAEDTKYQKSSSGYKKWKPWNVEQ